MLLRGKVTRTVDATGHSEVVDVAVAPTFTETGLTEGSHCSVCGTVIVAQEVVPVKPSKAEVLSEALTVDGTSISGEVSHATEAFSFADDISVTNDSSWVLSTDAYGLHTIVTKTAPLSEGDNTYYIHVTNPDTTVTTYTVDLYRKHMYTVSFDTDGGTGVDTQYVEEGSLAAAPSTTRVGYTFASWDYDFSTPITSNVTVTANWTANTGIGYKVEYYLENASKNGYEEPIVVNLSGTTDATVNAEQRVFEHFTLDRSKSTLSGKIKGDGSLVLKVYYTRNTYNIATGRNNTSAGTVTGGGTYSYDKQITLIATTNTGYTFLGWYEKGALVSSNASYTVTVRENKTFEARWQINTYTVSVSKNISNAGLVYGDGIYDYGTHVTVSAETNTGYTFLGWYENGSLVSPYEHYTFALYTSDRSLEARWKTNPYTGNESYNNDFQGIDLSRPDYDYDGDGVKDSHAMVESDGFLSDLGGGNVAVYDPEDATNIVWKIPMGITKPGTDNTNNTKQSLGISPSYTIDSNLFMEWNIYIPTGATGRVQYQFITNNSGWVALFNLDVNNAQIVFGSGWIGTAGKGMSLTRDEWHSMGYALNMVTGDWEMFLDGEFIAFGNLGCTYITVTTGYVIMGKVQTGYTGKGYILMDNIKINAGFKPDGVTGGSDSFVPSWYEQDFEEFADGENISELFPNRAAKNGEYEEQFVADVDGNKVWKREIDAAFNDAWSYLDTPLVSYRFSEEIVIQASYYLPTGATGYFVAQGFGANVPASGMSGSSWMHLWAVDVTNGRICNHKDDDIYYIVNEEALMLSRDTWITVTYFLDMSTGGYNLFVDGEFCMAGMVNKGCTDITFSEGYFDVCNTIYLDEYPPEEGSYIYVDDVSITEFTGDISDYFTNK